MIGQNVEGRYPDDTSALKSAKEIQGRKTDLLFQYLRDVQELNRQLRMIEISKEVAQAQREHDRALGELLVRFGK